MPINNPAPLIIRSVNGAKQSWPASTDSAVAASPGHGVATGVGQFIGQFSAVGSSIGQNTSAAIGTTVGSGSGPSVTTVTGTIAQGGSITISGNNFSTSRSNTVISDNFENGTVGQPLSGPNIDISSYYNYSSTSPFSGTKCVRADWNFVQGGGAIYTLPNMTEVLADLWVRIQIPTLGSSGDQQIKLPRLAGGHTQDHGSSPTILPIWQMGNSGTQADQVAVYVNSDGDTTYGNEWNGNAHPTLNVWERMSIYYKLGSHGVANGARFFRTSYQAASGQTSSGFPGGEFADPSGALNKTEYVGAPIVTMRDGVSFEYLGQFFLPFYQRNTMHSIIDVDLVTIHDGLGRVELTDNANWFASDPHKRIIQTQSARNASSISIDSLELGSLGSSGNVFVHVFNNDGLHAAGFQVR